MRLGKVLVASALAAFIGAPALRAQDGKSWPMYRGAGGDGISQESGWSVTWPASGPRILWKANVGEGYSSVAIANGRLYTMGSRANKDVVSCRDAADGREIWSFSYDCRNEGYPGPRATPTLDLSDPDGASGSRRGGDRVYTVSRRGQLHCLDAGSGKRLWSQDLPRTVGAKIPLFGYSCSPVIFENLLILPVGADDGAVVALDKNDGKLVWKSGEGQAGYSTPVLYEKAGPDKSACVAVFAGDALLALDAKTGTPLWRLPYPVKLQQAIASPIVSGDRIFISAAYRSGGALVDVSGVEPRIVWRNVEFSNQLATSVLWKGCLYGMDGDHERPHVLKCVDFATGAVKWTAQGFGKGSLMLADGKLIITSDNGALVIAEATPRGYRELARASAVFGVCWTMPVLCGGRIYVRNHAGDFVCLDVSGK